MSTGSQCGGGSEDEVLGCRRLCYRFDLDTCRQQHPARFIGAFAVPSAVVMNGKLRKLLAFASCWLVSLSCVVGAEHAATVDGILRSVVAVRSQLEPVLTYRLAQRTTTRPQMTRMGGLSCGSSIAIPGLQRLFKCVTTDKPAVDIQDRADDFNLRYSPVEVVNSEMKATWSTYENGGTSDRSRPAQREPVRANPLGLLFPSLQQINQFNQWQRPYQSSNQLPAATTTTTTTTTGRPHVDDFYFPPSDDDRVTPLSTARPTQYYTTPIPSSGHGPGQHLWVTSTPGSTSWPGSDVTKGPLEESTTDPPEDDIGLGNRIDNKLLLSLVG
ncbi:uncharacterized protein LOC118508572 isoform X2 [Anopheles stephensi]|uniref:uncharacterized protein LOC118508572 isoform X2 n=1 Tax=Anopheles stephensi TaxID=30069 RepID=UPI0016587F1A|nr:uncharacterized protein LOC118508572 isoform X2 [Anopheles stephensi]